MSAKGTTFFSKWISGVTALAVFLSVVVAPVSSTAWAQGPSPKVTDSDEDSPLDGVELEAVPETTKQDANADSAKKPVVRSLYLVAAGMLPTLALLRKIRSGEVRSFELRYNLSEKCLGCIGAFLQVIHHPGIVNGKVADPIIMGPAVPESSQSEKMTRGFNYADYSTTVELVRKDYTQLWGKIIAAKTGVGVLGGAAGFGALMYGLNWAAKIESKKLQRVAAVAEMALETLPKRGVGWHGNGRFLMLAGALFGLASATYYLATAGVDHVAYNDEIIRRDFLHHILSLGHEMAVVGAKVDASILDESEMIKRLNATAKAQGMDQLAQAMQAAGNQEKEIVGPARDIIPSVLAENMDELEDTFELLGTKYAQDSAVDRDIMNQGFRTDPRAAPLKGILY